MWLQEPSCSSPGPCPPSKPPSPACRAASPQVRKSRPDFAGPLPWTLIEGSTLRCALPDEPRRVIRVAEIHTAPDSTPPPAPTLEPRLPRGVPFFAVIAVAVLVLLVGGAGGAYQGKLSEVQKNDNSSYLPASAESTRAAGEAAAFNPAQLIPGFCADGAAAWAGGCGRRCGSSGGSAPCRAHLPDRWNRDGRVSGSARVRDVGARRHLGGLVRRFAPGPVAASAVDHRGGPLRRIGSSGRGD